MTTKLNEQIAQGGETLMLNDRERILLRALLIGAISDDWTRREYYILGGHGMVNLHYNSRTLPNMERRGLVKREGSSVVRITDLGRNSIQSSP